MNGKDRPEGPKKPPFKGNMVSLGLQTSSSLATGQQVRRKKKSSKYARRMQSVLQGTGRYRQQQQQIKGHLADFRHQQQGCWASLG